MAKVSLESHVLGDLEARDDAPLDLLVGFACRLAGSCDTLFGIDTGGKQIDRARRVPFEAGLAAFRESPWPVVSDRLVVILHDIRITTNTSMNIREISGPIMTQSYDSVFYGIFIRHK